VRVPRPYSCPMTRGSMLVTYLRRAEKSGNLTVWAQAQALQLEGGKRVTGVVCTGWTRARREVSAGIVVVWAAPSSARLLLLSDINPASRWARTCGFRSTWTCGCLDAKAPDVLVGSPSPPYVLRGRQAVDSGSRNMARSRGRSTCCGSTTTHPPRRARRHRGSCCGGVAEGDGRACGAPCCARLWRVHPHPAATDLDPDVVLRRRSRYRHHARVSVAKALSFEGGACCATAVRQRAHARVLGEALILRGGTCRFSTASRTA
jgi:hypothetical protein